MPSTDPGKRLRLVLAARLSHKQDDGSEGMGLQTQDKKSRPWAEHEGHEIIHTAADTKRGTVAPWDRPNLRPWVTDPQKMALYDGVLAYAMDRLSRGKQEDFTRIEYWAVENGKKLVIVNGPWFPARDDSDYWQWTAQKREARKEWEVIQERNQRNIAELNARGKLHGRPPWGYETTGGKYERTLVSTEQGRLFVPMVFEQIAEGHSGNTVASWLTASTGRKWWPARVYAMIRCRTYMGHRTSADGVVLLRCEPLVEPGLWHRANRSLDSRRTGGGPRDSRREGRAMLTGAAVCGNPDCTAKPDSPMYRHGDVHLYYRCSGRGAHRVSCGTMVRLDAADSAVDDMMLNVLAETKVTERRLVQGKNWQAEIDEIRYQLAELPKQGLDEDTEDEVRAQLRAERKRLEGLEAEDDHWEERPTGQTYGDVWAGLDTSERGPWLRSHGLSVRLTRDRAVLVEDIPGPWDGGTRTTLVPFLPEQPSGSGRVLHAVPLEAGQRQHSHAGKARWTRPALGLEEEAAGAGRYTVSGWDVERAGPKLWRAAKDGEAFSRRTLAQVHEEIARRNAGQEENHP